MAISFSGWSSLRSKTNLELEIAIIEPESSSMESCSWNPVHGIRIEKQDWESGLGIDPRSKLFRFRSKTSYHPSVNIHLWSSTSLLTNNVSNAAKQSSSCPSRSTFRYSFTVPSWHRPSQLFSHPHRDRHCFTSSSFNNSSKDAYVRGATSSCSTTVWPSSPRVSSLNKLMLVDTLVYWMHIIKDSRNYLIWNNSFNWCSWRLIVINVDIAKIALSHDMT